MGEYTFAQDSNAPSSIQEYAAKIFSRDNETQFIQTALFDQNGATMLILKNNDDFEAYLAKQEDQRQKKSSNETDSVSSQDVCTVSSSYCILTPTHGWGRVQITEENMRRLGNQCDCFPGLYRYLSCFGIKGFPRDEGFTGFEIDFKRDETGSLCRTELCYLLKYVELKDDGPMDTNNPWSIRHSLIYLSAQTMISHSDYILVRPTQNLCRRLKEFSKCETKDRQQASRHWAQTHSMFFDQVAEQWRLYINYLDQETEALFDRVDFVEVEPTTSHEFIFIANSVQDMKRLIYLTDQALRTQLNLELNIEVFQLFLHALTEARSSEGPEMKSYYDQLERRLRAEISAHKFSKMTVSSLIARQKILSQELRDLTALRNTEVNKQMARSSNSGTEAIVALSHNAGQEARIVKVLSILAVIFVPASFAADFMNMGFIKVSQTEGFEISADKGLWLFAILAIPLVIITVAIYALFEISNRRKRMSSIS